MPSSDDGRARELRERLLAYLRGAAEERRSYGIIKTKCFAMALGVWVEVSFARYRDGKYRIFVMRTCPYEGPKLVLRLVCGDEPLAATCFTPGDWLDQLPTPARVTGEPEKFRSHHSHDGKTRRSRPWTAS
jgi:hypothetical protein